MEIDSSGKYQQVGFLVPLHGTGFVGGDSERVIIHVLLFMRVINKSRLRTENSSTKLRNLKG